MSLFIVPIIIDIKSLNFKPFGDQKQDEARAKVSERVQEQRKKDIDYWIQIYLESLEAQGKLPSTLPTEEQRYDLAFWEGVLRDEIHRSSFCDKCGCSLKRNKPE